MATKPHEVYNSSFATNDGTFKVVDEARVPRETIQRGDKFFVVEDYAAIIGTPWTAPDGTEIITAERIPVVKLDRNGAPIKGTVLWVSQLCPQDVTRLNVFESPIYDARQEGTLVNSIKGKVLTAVESKVVPMRKWDNKAEGYVTHEDGSFVGVEKAAFRFSAANPASVVDTVKATDILKKYLENNYAGILKK